jgi:hypothetical protein
VRQTKDGLIHDRLRMRSLENLVLKLSNHENHIYAEWSLRNSAGGIKLPAEMEDRA